MDESVLEHRDQDPSERKFSHPKVKKWWEINIADASKFGALVRATSIVPVKKRD